MRQIKYLLGLVAILAATALGVAQPAAPTSLSQVSGVEGFSLGDTYATFNFTGTADQKLKKYNIYRDGALVDSIDMYRWTFDQKLGSQFARRGFVEAYCRFDYFGGEATDCSFPTNLFYTAQNLAAETAYSFTVTSVDTLGVESAPSTALQVTTLEADDFERLVVEDTWITGNESRAINFSDQYYVRVSTRDGFDSWHAQRRPFIKFSVPDTVEEVKSAIWRSYITTRQRPSDRNNPVPPVDQAVYVFPVSAEWSEGDVTFDDNPVEDIGYDPLDGTGIDALTDVDSIEGGLDAALTTILFPSTAYENYIVRELNFTDYVNTQIAEGVYDFAFTMIDSTDGGEYRNDLYQWYSANSPAFQSHFEIELEPVDDGGGITANKDYVPNQFKAYPNPAVNKKITMEMRQSGTYEITLIDLQGRSSFQTVEEGQKIDISLKGVDKGLYIIKSRNTQTGVISSQRIVIE